MPTPQLLQFSIVVLGKSHNPTILNPDFLRLRGIVPTSWGWEVAETFTIPPLSLVRYTNGVSLTVQDNKLQVSDLNPPDPTVSKIPTIVASYVRVLEHVRYTAVGINFQAVLEAEDPDALVKERFIKDGPWDSPAHALSAVGLRLSYPLEEQDCRLLFSIDSGEVRKADEPEAPVKALLVSGNFHRPCSSYPAVQEVGAHVGLATDDWQTFQTMFDDVLVAGVT